MGNRINHEALVILGSTVGVSRTVCFNAVIWRLTGERAPFPSPGRGERKAKDNKKSIEGPGQLACLYTESLGGDPGLVQWK